MKTLAFNFTSSHIYLVVLSGDNDNPTLAFKDRLNLPENLDPSGLAQWFENQIEAILNNQEPNKIVYNLSINNVKYKYVHNVYFAQAITNLLAKKRNIDIAYMAPNAITNSKFGLAKGDSLPDYLDGKIGAHPPHWNKNMRNASLMALLNL